eukprot:350218-Chlamydomonas_euryale.AAC.1
MDSLQVGKTHTHWRSVSQQARPVATSQLLKAISANQLPQTMYCKPCEQSGCHKPALKNTAPGKARAAHPLQPAEQLNTSAAYAPSTLYTSMYMTPCDALSIDTLAYAPYVSTPGAAAVHATASSHSSPEKHVWLPRHEMPSPPTIRLPLQKCFTPSTSQELSVDGH